MNDDPNEALWKSLRSKGHILNIYVVDRLLVMVDGVEMSFGDARAFNDGRVTLDELARRRAQSR